MNILHIDCSPREASHSRALSAAIVARITDVCPTSIVIRRDLGYEPIPPMCADYADTLSSPAALTAERATSATRLSEQLIQEVERADVIVIGTPMNNFTIPSVLKAWLDQVLRVGRTIGMNADGEKTGLLQDKPVYIGVASGGIFTSERAIQPDFLTPYLSAALACIGLRSVQYFPLQGTAFLSHEQLMTEQNRLLEEIH